MQHEFEIDKMTNCEFLEEIKHDALICSYFCMTLRKILSNECLNCKLYIEKGTCNEK